MLWGTEHEADARTVYEFETGNVVQEVGYIAHPVFKFSGASPDGLVGDDGMVEIKCPNTATHIETLLSQTVPKRYYTQMQWQLGCTGRKWCDFVSYDPRMKDAELVLFSKRVGTDEPFLVEAMAAVVEAEKELCELVEKIRALK